MRKIFLAFLLIPSIALSALSKDQSGVSIRSKNAVMSKVSTTHYQATLETNDGYVLVADKLITHGPIKNVIRAEAFGNPVRFREVSKTGVLIYYGEAAEAVYSREEATVRLKEYSVKDAAGNVMKSHNGVFNLGG